MSASHNGNGTGNHNEPQLTPVEEWQRLRLHGAVKTLESTGRVIKWRPVNLTRMLKEGKIPDNLTAYVAHRLWAGIADDERSDLEKLLDWQEYHVVVATACLLFPIVTENPKGAGEIHPDDLLDVELVEIERMVRNPSDEVRRFRGEPERDVDALPKGEQVQQAAK